MNHEKSDRDQSNPSLIAGRFSRRNFLGLAGIATATLALPKSLMAESWAYPASGTFPQVQLAGTHDLVSLPLWGPYSKKHFGISHIPDVHRGLSFDLSVFPVSPHLPAKLPSVTSRHSGVHPWEAAPKLDYYSFRFETLWKDQLYTDISFSAIDEQRRLIRMEIVNRTDEPRKMVLHNLAQMCFPPLEELTAEPIRLYSALLPPGALWIGALDYIDLQFAKPRPTDNLVPDGKWRGEERRHDTVGGSVIAQKFGIDAGDRVHYRVYLDRSFSDAILIWRYSLEPGKSALFQMSGDVSRQITFKGEGKFSTVAVPLGALQPGMYDLLFTSNGGADPALNGFTIVEAEQAAQVQFLPRPWHPVPEIVPTANDNGLILKYEDVDDYYGFALQAPLAGHRLLPWCELHAAFDCKTDPVTQSRIFGSHGHPGDPDSLFVHTWSQVITVPAHTSRTMWGLACTGTKEQVWKSLDEFHLETKKNQQVFSTARKLAFQPDAEPSASSYDLSHRLMAAVTLTNLVYPLYTQGNYIRDYSPGKIWDCLYTWDAGFIGLGLLELDPRCALDTLNAYTTPEGAQSAFIHHGTPLPVQIYLYYELWNRIHSREMLSYFYPRLRQYHLFMAGKLGSSTTRRHQDHLICTWDYFYNSGGWDDYPPQKFVHQHNLTSLVAPAVNSSHTIRCARLLRRIAEELGRQEDCAEYDADIAVLSSSLQKYSWDASSGYYGYVMHDKAGKPTGILRASNGVNFNMGLDGVSPLIAGICSPQQTQQILDHLFSSQRMWTGQGITSVDQTAPYYNPNGYWNGSVWFAHQWFLWKTMLDLGRGDLAIRIAQTGLNTWKKVTDASYNCMEHFVPHPPFGEGWVQFSSLSSPALSWFGALHTPGRLTCGFDVWLHNCQFDQDSHQIRARLQHTGNPAYLEFSILACMPSSKRYRVLWNGATIHYRHIENGLLQIQIPTNKTRGELLITAD